MPFLGWRRWAALISHDNARRCRIPETYFAVETSAKHRDSAMQQICMGVGKPPNSPCKPEAFFSTIATFAPLEAFPVQYVGAVSAAVQASSLKCFSSCSSLSCFSRTRLSLWVDPWSPYPWPCFPMLAALACFGLCWIRTRQEPKLFA